MQYFVVETFSVSRVILLSWICIIPPCRLTVVMKMHNYPFNLGNSRFWNKQRWYSTSSLVRLLENKTKNVMNFCNEMIKNYEQLSSSISKFQAPFSKIRALFGTFFGMFWALFGVCSSANMPSDRDHLSQQRADGSFPCIVPAEESEDTKLEEVPVVRYFLSLVAYLTLRRKSLHSSNATGWVLCRIGKERTTTQKRPICAFCDSARVGLRTLRTFCL